MLLAGCAPNASGAPSKAATDWGPLTVIRMDVGDMNLAQHVGVMQIGQMCVAAGGLLLIWPDSQTRWDATRAVIVFDDPLAHKIVELADGDEVTLGGGELARGAFPWVNAPDKTCPTDTFQVSTVTSINGVPVR